ncbi:MAG: hypothetical protein F4X92_03730 [Gammaproteobacteria bacterium]|nr:hypothetical protein [Gammaproteobacteria bacterium]
MIRNEYRHGAVLGLTVAEIFILLAFLLLFTLLGFLTDTEEEKHELAQTSDLESAPVPWVRPEQYEALIREYRIIQQEREKAIATIEQKQRDHAQLQSQIESLKQEIGQKQEEVDLANLAKIDSESALNMIEKKLDTVRYEKQAVERELYIQKKGDQPACWYTIVPEGGGGYREKRNYIFDVAVFEDGIALTERPAPEGGAYDDNGGAYDNERQELDVANLPYGRKLSDEEFLEAVRNISDKGREREVRTYPCVFSVKVWDLTPKSAKERWQYVHYNLIQSWFSTFVVQDETWTGITE